MSWLRITMKFPGTCIVCNEKINANEIGLWSKGIGIKHEKCVESKELQCLVCGGSAGCYLCEFRDDCNLELVSQLCICNKCGEKNDPFTLYQDSAKKKFLFLNLKI